MRKKRHDAVGQRKHGKRRLVVEGIGLEAAFEIQHQHRDAGGQIARRGPGHEGDGGHVAQGVGIAAEVRDVTCVRYRAVQGIGHQHERRRRRELPPDSPHPLPHASSRLPPQRSADSRSRPALGRKRRRAPFLIARSSPSHVLAAPALQPQEGRDPTMDPGLLDDKGSSATAA